MRLMHVDAVDRCGAVKWNFFYYCVAATVYLSRTRIRSKFVAV